MLNNRDCAEHVGDQIVQKASADRIRFHATCCTIRQLVLFCQQSGAFNQFIGDSLRNDCILAAMRRVIYRSRKALLWRTLLCPRSLYA